MANTGWVELAKPFAGAFIHLFEPVDYVVCPSGICMAMIRVHYRDLLALEAPVAVLGREIQNLLVTRSRAVLHTGHDCLVRVVLVDDRPFVWMASQESAIRSYYFDAVLEVPREKPIKAPSLYPLRPCGGN